MQFDKNYLVWLCVAEISRANLDVPFIVHGDDEGQPVWGFFEGDDNIVDVDTFEKYTQLRVLVHQYRTYLKNHGHIIDIEGRTLFYPYQLATILRKQFNNEPLSAVELLIVSQPEPENLSFPFAHEQMGDYVSLLGLLVEEVDELSEDTAFWLNVTTHEYDRVNKRSVQLAEPTFRISVDCSDFFHSACADSEEITMETFPVYKKALNEVREAYQPQTERDADNYDWYVSGIASKLYASRVRNSSASLIRLRKYPQEIVELFDR